MKRLIISVAAFLGISSIAMTSCQEQWENRQNEAVSVVAAEMKKALKAQMDEFFSSDDLEESLGITQEQISRMEQSLEQYVDSYEVDAGALTKLTDELELLIDEAKGLTKEEFQTKLDEILEK